MTYELRELSANTFVASRHASVVNLQAGEYVSYNGSEYKVGSVVSYAQERGDCPALAVETALAAGHELWWFNPCPVIIARTPVAPKKIAATVEDGQVVRVEGRFLKIVPARNRNVKLVPLTAGELAETFDFEPVTVP